MSVEHLTGRRLTARSARKCDETCDSTAQTTDGGGRPHSISLPMREVLREHLLEKPGQYLDELAVFLWDEFEVLVTNATISDMLTRGLDELGMDPSSIYMRQTLCYLFGPRD
jgi:hypothetical protein